MNITEFRRELIDYLEHNNDSIEIIDSDILKNNSVKLCGITIKRKDKNVLPTIYLEEYFEKYKKGYSLENIAIDILEFEEKNIFVHEFDEKFFNEFEKVKPFLFAKIINTNLNSELLETIPNRPFLDLSIVAYCDVSSMCGMNASVLVKNEHICMWEVEKETIIEIALSNSKERGFKLFSMKDIAEKYCEDSDKCNETLYHPGTYMDIYTTKNKLFGAISMLFLENNKDIDEDGVYIIPSSIHEVILLPKKMCESEEYINNIIREVNDSSVEKQEVLSDHAYYYNESEGYRIV